MSCSKKVLLWQWIENHANAIIALANIGIMIINIIVMTTGIRSFNSTKEEFEVKDRTIKEILLSSKDIKVSIDKFTKIQEFELKDRIRRNIELNINYNRDLALQDLVREESIVLHIHNKNSDYIIEGIQVDIQLYRKFHLEGSGNCSFIVKLYDKVRPGCHYNNKNILIENINSCLPAMIDFRRLKPGDYSIEHKNILIESVWHVSESERDKCT